METVIDATQIGSTVYPVVCTVESGANVNFSGVSFTMKINGSAYAAGGAVTAQMLSVAGNTRFIVDEELPIAFIAPISLPTGTVIIMMNASGGQLIFDKSRNAYDTHKILCQGACTIVAQAEVKGSIGYTGSGNYYFTPCVAPGKTVTGKRYNCISGGSINTNGKGDKYFPGDDDWYVESSTYSWYK